jgi:hypothetical protein
LADRNARPLSSRAIFARSFQYILNFLFCHLVSAQVRSARLIIQIIPNSHRRFDVSVRWDKCPHEHPAALAFRFDGTARVLAVAACGDK